MSGLTFIQPDHPTQLLLRGELQIGSRRALRVLLVLAMLMIAWQYIEGVQAGMDGTQYALRVMGNLFYTLLIAFTLAMRLYAPLRLLVSIFLGASVLSTVSMINELSNMNILAGYHYAAWLYQLVSFGLLGVLYHREQRAIRKARTHYYDEARAHYEKEDERFADAVMKHDALKPSVNIFQVFCLTGFAVFWIVLGLMAFGYALFQLIQGGPSALHTLLGVSASAMGMHAVYYVKSSLVDHSSEHFFLAQFLTVLGFIVGIGVGGYANNWISPQFRGFGYERIIGPLTTKDIGVGILIMGFLIIAMNFVLIRGMSQWRDQLKRWELDAPDSHLRYRDD